MVREDNFCYHFDDFSKNLGPVDVLKRSVNGKIVSSGRIFWGESVSLCPSVRHAIRATEIRSRLRIAESIRAVLSAPLP
jgi:hypothetical protein